MKKTTIYDVAKRAGCSTATVSMVLKNSDRITSERKKHVIKVIEEMNYIPNHFAQGLNTKRNMAIGLVVPDMENPVFSKMITGVEEYVDKKGYRLILGVCNHNRDKEAVYLDLIHNNHVDGMIVFPTFLDNTKKIIDDWEASEFPVVLCGLSFEDSSISYVKCDSRMGAYMATDHLIERGRRKIAFIAPVFEKSMADTRINGYMDALRVNGIDFDESLTVYCQQSFDSVYEAAKDLLNDAKPDSIVCLYDYIAIPVMRAASELGLKIPEDISVIGYDNIDVSGYLPVALSTVETQSVRIGELAAEIMVNKINGTICKHDQIVLQPKLIIREST